jgi:hypothetical protein
VYDIYQLYFSRNNIGYVTENETRPSLADLLISVNHAPVAPTLIQACKFLRDVNWYFKYVVASVVLLDPHDAGNLQSSVRLHSKVFLSPCTS